MTITPERCEENRIVDKIYIAASKLDGRFTRICVASIRYFYPDIEIDILPGGKLEPGLAKELLRYWSVGVADLPDRDYGWGFVKLEPLFWEKGLRFLILDSDTVITGPVLDAAAHLDGDLIVDDELYDEQRGANIYYDWKRAPALTQPAQPPSFLFNTGQWFGKSGAIGRTEFSTLIDWEHEPPMLRNPEIFKNGDQGVLNYVANKLTLEGKLAVTRVPLLCWPGNGLDSITAKEIIERTAPVRVIHWAGMKKTLLSQMVGPEILNLFENYYYSRVKMRSVRRPIALYLHIQRQLYFSTTRRIRAWIEARRAPRPTAEGRSGDGASKLA